MTSPLQAASFFVHEKGSDKSTTMRLLSWSQGYFTAFTGEQLFSESIDSVEEDWAAVEVTPYKLSAPARCCLDLVGEWFLPSPPDPHPEAEIVNWRDDFEERAEQYFTKLFCWDETSLSEHVNNATELNEAFSGYAKAGYRSWRESSKNGILM